MSDEALVAFRDAQNRTVSSSLARVITGFPDRRATIGWQQLTLPDRVVPLSAAVDDGWDVLRHVVRHAAQWGVDPARVAVVGESAGSMVAALAAIRARKSDLDLRAQVLVNPCADLTSTAFDYASMTEHGRAYADRLREAGTLVRLTEHSRAGHAFLSMPGLVPAARPARREILTFLHGHLHPAKVRTAPGS